MMWKFVVLIVVAGINLLTGLWVFSKNYKSRLRLSFLLLSLALFFWCFSVSLQDYYAYFNQLAGILFGFRMAYVSALLIAPALVYFSYFAPLELPLDTRLKKFLWVPIFLSVFLIINSNFVITRIELTNLGFSVDYNIFGYIVFSTCFLFYMGLAFYILIKRYLFSDGIIKKALSYILFGLSVGSIFGVIFDLILPFGGYWKLLWLGPCFSLFLAFSIVYLILHKEK